MVKVTEVTVEGPPLANTSRIFNRSLSEIRSRVQLIGTPVLEPRRARNGISDPFSLQETKSNNFDTFPLGVRSLHTHQKATGTIVW